MMNDESLSPADVISRLPRRTPVPTHHPGPVLDVVVPVFNEETDLEPNVRRLHAHLSEAFPYPFRITVADNASTDRTPDIAARLAAELPGTEWLRLPEKGRGRALRAAWSRSPAPVLAYVDVDLSTELAALLPLVAPLISGHSDLAIGTRLAPASRVVRGPKREVTSRCYNALLRSTLAVGFSDAQCGFKAVRRDVADVLLPLVEDTGWFFDTELLVIAERAGLRIHEVPVDWVDDPDSRVDILATALADLRGIARIGGALARGTLTPAALRFPAPDDTTAAAPTEPSAQLTRSQPGLGVQLTSAEAGEGARLTPAQSGPVAQLDGARPGSGVQLTRAEVGEGARLTPAQLGLVAQLDGVQPGLGVQLTSAEVGEAVRLTPAQLGPVAQLDGARPGLGVQLTSAEAGEAVRLTPAQLGPAAQLDGAQRGLGVQLTSAEAGEGARLTPAQSGPAAQLDGAQPGPAVQLTQAQPGPAVQQAQAQAPAGPPAQLTRAHAGLPAPTSQASAGLPAPTSQASAGPPAQFAHIARAPAGPAAQLARFAAVGAMSTVGHLLLYAALSPALGVQAANALALLLCALANTAANRRLTFGHRGRGGALRHHGKGLVVFLIGLALTSGSLAALHHAAPSAGHATDLAVLLAANLTATVLRFLLLRAWVFRA
ncbi:glycosyltransferase [Streptomyces hokutonensis]|uniref:glycosyltransferase n=1 Tax=Streptomyces hokutonensis TaxID=1306990 RepID=UPI0036CD6639